MTLYYSKGGITIFHGDCRDVLPTLPAGSIDLVLTDPPYGMAWNNDSTRFSGGQSPRIRRSPLDGRDDWPEVKGDDEPFDPTPWLGFPRVILWGANHYAARLPVGTTLVWIKKDDHLFGTFLSDAEVGWMKGGYGVYCRKDTSILSESKRRWHPNRKPVGLMAWCLKLAKAEPGALILDPFMGSGTTLRAAKDAGCKAIGIEIEERYCEIAARRLEQEVFAWGESM